MKIRISEKQYKKLSESNNISHQQWNKIYNDLWDEILYGVCMKYTNDINTAQDYCQNGFIKVYQNINKFTGGGSLKGWIKKVISNNIIDELRKKKLQYTTDEPDWARMDAPESEEYKEEGISVEDIMRASDRLSPKFRAVFDLYSQGYKHEEIADELGINIGTSKSNLYKAKANIRKLLGK